MNVGGNMKKTKTLNLLIVLLTMFALTSCAFIQKTNKRKQIVTTLYPEYDMINKIIGTNQETKDLFDVTLIIPPGQDSHTFDPSIQDLITIKNADIFIYTADEMETWVKDVDFGTDTIVIDLSKIVTKKLMMWIKLQELNFSKLKMMMMMRNQDMITITCMHMTPIIGCIQYILSIW